MTGTAERTAPMATRPSPTVKVARDLTEITRCYAELEAQAISDGDNPDLPGGPAMIALGPVADLETWANLADTTAAYEDHPNEHLRRAYTSVEDEDDDEGRWPPQQTIAYWAGRWRSQRGQDYDGLVRTAASEVNYVRTALPWAVEHEPQWDTFVDDIHRARVRAENLVSAGRRSERSRIVCDRPTCLPSPPRLVKTYSPRYLTGWTCRTCETHTPTSYRCTNGHPAPVSAEPCHRQIGPKGQRIPCEAATAPDTPPPAACCNTHCPSFEPPAEGQVRWGGVRG